MRALPLIAAVCAVGAAAAPSGAAAQALTPAERERFAREAPALGPEHALEHIQADRKARASQSPYAPCPRRLPASQIDRATPPPAPGPTGQAQCSPLPDQPNARNAARQGRWEKDTLDLPHYAIHAALLPSGKVLFWGFDWTPTVITRENQQVAGVATLWDPAKGSGPASMRAVPPPVADVNGDGKPEEIPVYCSGQSFLPDGRLLVTGGMLETDYQRKGHTFPPGHRVSLVFDPATERWATGPLMTQGRWYPTQTLMSDGRTLVLGGFSDAKPNDLSTALDVVSDDGASVRHAAKGDRRVFLYPFMTTMPDGKVLLAGPFRRDSALLDPKTLRWRSIKPLPQFRGGGNLLPLEGGRAMLIGGAPANVWFDRVVDAPAFRSTLTYAHSERRWRVRGAQRRARHYPNTVLLPDGSMVTIGGSSGITPDEGNYTPSLGNRRVELWDGRRWRLGAAQREDRTYHSVALLLPDGRVWSAGDDANPTRHGDTGEIYSPPYLFKGARPRITSVPARVAYGKAFTVRATRTARRVVLIAPSAVTHGVDMSQRRVPLLTAKRGGRLTARAPGRRVAPPGRYMLFVLDAKGVPSGARWVSVE